MIRPANDPEVIVLGGAAMDWVAQVDTLPGPDGLAVAHAYGSFPGGSAANVAVGIARLGRRVAFAGKLGDDAAGRELMDAFAEEGVDTSQVIVESGRPTATCFIGLDRLGERVIFALPGASLIEDPVEMDPSCWAGSRLLYAGPSYPPVAQAAAGAARDAGITTILAPGGGWDGDGLALLRPALAHVDLLLLSSSEARNLTGRRSVADALDHLATLGPPVVVATQGAGGATLLEAGRWSKVPPCAAPAVRDTTGAGDAFAAGLVVGFLEAQSNTEREGQRGGTLWEEAARLGSAAAALKLPHVGARNGLPTRAQVSEAMADWTPVSRRTSL